MSSNSTVAKTIEQSWTSTASTLYKICFKITNFTPGLRNAFASVIVEDSGGNVLALHGGDPLIDGNADEQCVYVLSADATTKVIFSTSMIGSFRLDDVVVTEATTTELLTITIEDSDGTTVKTITDIVSIGEYSMVSIDWTGLQAGTYRICISGIGDTAFDYLAQGAALTLENGGKILLEPASGKDAALDIGWIRWV